MRRAGLIVALLLAPAIAWGQGTFSVSFDDATYLRLLVGTRDGLQSSSPEQPEATTGLLLDRADAPIGTFMTVYADEFDAIVRVEELAASSRVEDIDHVSVPDLGIEYLKLRREDSATYFRIDQGWDDDPSGILEHGAKGRLWNDERQPVAQFRIVAVAADHTPSVRSPATPPGRSTATWWAAGFRAISRRWSPPQGLRTCRG